MWWQVRSSSYLTENTIPFWSKIADMKESECDGMQAWVYRKVLGTSVKTVKNELGIIIGNGIRNVREDLIA